MTAVLESTLEIVERFDAAETAAAAGRAFFDALVPLGARGFGARAYAAAIASSTGDSAVSLAQVLPSSWRGSASAKFVESLDPLPKAARRLRRPAFLWSEASPRSDPQWADYWDALQEHGMSDGTTVHVFAPGGVTSRVSVGFERALDKRNRRVVELASYALLDRMQAFSPQLPSRAQLLSQRECDCLALVAQGCSDNEIATRLGLAETTVHFYIEKAKRKLGAKTRAQAVARLIATGLR